MFGLGVGEILIVLAFALIFIGPKKLPELAKSLGKGLREFQRAKDEILENMDPNQPSSNNSAQQFESDDHIEAEVTGVSEVDEDDTELTEEEQSDESEENKKV